MDDELTAALVRLREAFARYPRRPLLDGCPHCRGSVAVDEDDLFSLTLSLGNTVGTSDDVKSLLPLLLERLARGSDLDESIVLGKLVREGWRSWPTVEQEAISDYLTAVWRSLLTKHPPRIGSFRDAAGFLSAIDELAESMAPFLSLWEGASGPAADRHLADLVTGWVSGSHLPDAVLTWLHRDSTRNRLYGAFELHHDTPWADDFARAYDYLASASRP